MIMNDLYQKVAGFEDSLSSEAKSLSHCKNGCSRCCYVDLSVFQIEADNIKKWFSGLPEDQKNDLKEKWKAPLNKMVNFHGDEVNSCPFLYQESCTIYEARPLICRTQGLALKFKDGAEEYIDICPLNDEMLEKLSSKEVLNLDLINLILSQLENLESKGTQRDRFSLSHLKSVLTLLLLVVIMPACSLIKREGSWGKKAIYPLSIENTKRAFVKHATSAHFWGPLAGAAVIAAGKYDKKISYWATEETPVFGSTKNASDYSDIFNDALLYEMYASILATPSWNGSEKDYLWSKAKGGVVVYFSSNLAEDVNNNIRKPIDRRRPDSSDRRSFPSGHATRTGASIAVLNRNIDEAEIGSAAATSLKVVNGIGAAGMLWSRVEARAHYPTDVLVGYSLGYLVSGFVFDTLMNLDSNESFALYPQGAGSVSALYTVGF